MTARKLLLLGLFLQVAQSYPSQDANGLGVDSRDAIMSRVIQAANDLVTCNDDLVGSVEGVDCLLLRSIYHNNTGNLRSSWLAVRRAMLMAQSIGLHRGVKEMLDPSTLIYIGPDYAWFRLLEMDHYLTLMLGFPMYYSANSFPDPMILKDSMPIESMQRIQLMVAGAIIQRNQAGVDGDLTLTLKMDKQLQEASSLMPSSWWLPFNTHSEEIAGRKVSIMDLFTHHHLMARLHLPYLLRSSADGKYDYSKIVTVNASREILSRFVSLRGPAAAWPGCRGIDFLAFIASTTLSIAHMEGRRQQEICSGDGKGNSTFSQFLMQQRLADRSLVKRTLEIMIRDGADRISSKIVTILQPLLDMEDDAVAGKPSLNSSSEVHPNHEGEAVLGGLVDSGKVLRIHIPYFGTIKIERGGVSKSSRDQEYSLQSPLRIGAPDHQMGAQPFDPPWSSPQVDYYGTAGKLTETFGSLVAPIADDDWALQGVDMALFDSLLCGASEDDSANREGRFFTI